MQKYKNKGVDCLVVILAFPSSANPIIHCTTHKTGNSGHHLLNPYCSMYGARCLVNIIFNPYKTSAR